jgi:DNA-binding CsgD family transcriptional regulator/tetratricopeptide (TPR) repeat protein
MTPRGEELIEREGQLARLEELCLTAAAGDGCCAVISGEAGIGKSALLHAGRYVAAGCGLRVLTARGADFEQSHAFGLVRQLLAPLVLGLDARERDAVFEGAAAHARAVLLPGPAAPESDFGVLHGLYWLIAALALEQPLALLVDDIHWGDTPSLRFLRFLQGRLDGLPVLIVLASRSGETTPGAYAAGEIADAPGVSMLTPTELTPAATEAIVARRLGRADQKLARECHRVTRGNPFYLLTLLEEVATDGQTPAVEAAERVPELVARSVRRRLDALGPDIRQLAEALAVLGDGARPARLATLAGMTPAAAAERLEQLAERRLVELGAGSDGGAAFTHPIVEAAVYSGQSPELVGERHICAARLLDADGAEPEEVAAQILRAPAGAVEGAAALLRAAAQRASAQGAPDLAATFLAGALREPAPTAERAVLLIELGQYELRAGFPQALSRLEEAAASASDEETRVSALISLARGLYASGRAEEGVIRLDAVHGELAASRPHLAEALAEEILSIASLDLGARAAGRPHLERQMIRHATAVEPDVSTAAQLAITHLMAADGAARAAELARRALSDESLLERALAGDPLFTLVAYVLIVAGRYVEAEERLETAIAAARQRGSAIAFAMASTIRALASVHRGDLADGEAHGRAALQLAVGNRWPPVAMAAVTALGSVLHADGRGPELAAEAAQVGVDLESLDDSTQGTVLRELRGHLRVAAGATTAGVGDLLAARERLRAWDVINPFPYGYHPPLVQGLLALGDRDQAARMAQEQADLAVRWGTPRAGAVAGMTTALLLDGDARIAALEGAAAAVRNTPAVLVWAEAETELGAALRRANRRADARAPLTEGLRLALQCGASGLADRARTELWATGARPRTPRRYGLDALTPSEQRIAAMAAAGATNPQIAQDLFVTIKTVEMHLSHTYRKLGIGSRQELRAALERPAAEAPG